MKILLKILMVIFIFQANSIADETITTNNLLDQDFNNWNGNIPILNDSIHNDGVLAGIENGYAEYTVNQTDIGLSADIVNRGFSSTFGADIWFWSQTDQTVKMTQSYDDGNGNIVNQHRTITGTCGNECYTNHNYNTFTDTLIVGENTATNGSVTARFDFNSSYNNPQYPLWHNGADVEHPTLKITYTLPEIVLPPIEEIIIDPVIEFVELPIFVEPIEIIEEEIEDVYIVETPISTGQIDESEPTTIVAENEPVEEPQEEIIEIEEEQIAETMEADIIEPEEIAEELVEEIEVEVVENNKPIIDPINVVTNINTQNMLVSEPSLQEYKAVQISDVIELPETDMEFFKQINLEGYNKTIYDSKKQKLAMLLNDPIYRYEVKLKEAQSLTDRAFKKLKESIGARNNI